MNQNRKKTLAPAFKWILTAFVALFLFYMELPPINLRSKDFYSYIMQILIFAVIIFGFSFIRNMILGLRMGYITPKDALGALKRTQKPVMILAIILLFIMLLQLLGDAIGHPVFHSKSYSQLIPIEEGDFTTDVSEINMNQIPVVDKTTAQRLGNRKLGEMSELVSQFVIMDQYTQINYKGTPYRVTPLAYGDMIKWFTNHNSGLPAYIGVNMVTQETKLFWLDEGMKYSPSEYFFHNIYRHVRFNHPTLMYDDSDISFEVDENGIPYWVVSVIDYRIGIWSGKDIKGAVLVNAITGESKYYANKDIPTWVDQLFISDLVIKQLNYYGMYQNGFLNSLFGQKGVKQTTSGYNYIAIDDDVYLYTGMTSVTSDDSNIGFMLVNLRTKEAKYYAVPGATEYSAMDSAEGQVQQMKYVATFPLLLNVSDRPTYFLSLKDAAGLVKMYAFVDVAQYQIVGTGTTVAAAKASYATALGIESGDISQDVIDKEPIVDLPAAEANVSGTVSDIASVVVGGNSCYYILLEGDDAIYAASITVDPALAFVKVGDKVTFDYAQGLSTRIVVGLGK